MATKTRMTLDEFLELPETAPASEFMNGEVVERMAPNWYHSETTVRLLLALRQYLDRTGEGALGNELRFRDNTTDRAYVPDMSVLPAARIPHTARARRETQAEPPALAVEVLSPGESASYIIEKVDFYLRIGVELVWVVDPEAETLTAYRADGSWATHHSAHIVDARPVLSDFSLDLRELFADLHGEEGDEQ